MGNAKKSVEQAVTEPQLEGSTVVVAIRGTEYTLCWDIEAVMRAEAGFAAQGHDLNLMDGAVRFNMSNLRMIFVAMLERYHSNLSFEERCKLWSTSTYQLLGRVTASIYIDAVKRDQQEGQPGPTVASAAL